MKRNAFMAAALLIGAALSSSASAQKVDLAQAAKVPPLPSASDAAAASASTPQAISVDFGSGRLVQLPRAAATVIAADPNIARVQPLSPTTLFVTGAGPGKTTIVATADNGVLVAQYDVTVRGGPPAPATAAPPEMAKPTPISAAAVQKAIRAGVPSATGIHVTSNIKGMSISGQVLTATDAQKVMALARAFGGEGVEISNELTVLSGIQVNVRVRIAEIDRSVTRQLGFNWQAIGAVGNFLIGIHTGAALTQTISALAPAAIAGVNGGPPPQQYGFNYTGRKFDVNGIIDALATDNLIKILAEPNLTAQSGETASFLAGGEFPVPIAGNTTNGQTTVTVEFKTFGISLAFVPTVLSPDRINLRVRPEVSQLTNNGAVSLPVAGGTLVIPALTVRRAETTVELGSGQSFAIAGLLQRNNTQTESTLPGIGELPVIGALFKSDQYLRDESELVIIVTPYIVKPVNETQALVDPDRGFVPANDLERILLNRQIGFGARPPVVPADSGYMLE